MSGCRKPWCLVAGVVIGGMLALGGWLWSRSRIPEPPPVSFEGVDPAVREAVVRAQEEVRRRPRASEAWGRLGMVLRAHDFAGSAETCFAEAARLDAKEPRWPYLHGRSLAQQDREKAVAYLEKAAELCSDKPLAPRLKLAETLLDLGKIDEADKHVRRALQVEAENARAQLAAGQIALARGDLASAADHLRRSSASPFARQKAHALLASILRRLGRTDEAAVAVGQSRMPPADLDFDLLDPFIEEVFQVGVSKGHRLAAASSLQAQGRMPEAVGLLRGLARDYPDVWSEVTLAEALLRSGDFAAAAQAAEAGIRMSPDTAQAHFFLGVARFHLAEGRGHLSEKRAHLGGAMASLQTATRLKPDHAFAYNYLGQALRLEGRWAEALSAFQQAIRSQPHFADPHLHLANLWTDLGCIPLALMHLHDASRLTGSSDVRSARIQARAISSCMLRGVF